MSSLRLPRLRVVLAVSVALLSAFSMAPPLVGAFSTNVVISQVYGGGGNFGATYTNDFIELLNTGSTTADVSNWSVQYASATGSSWQVTALPPATLAPGQYFLVQEAKGSGGTTPLPTPDQAGTIAMSAASGKVALVNSATGLSCGATCHAASGVVDYVGYGSATDAEGSPAPGLSNTTADLRSTCTDTDNNSADFAAGDPTPRNSAGTFGCGYPTVPVVTSHTPTSGASDVSASADISITFNMPVTVTDPWYDISCSSSGTHAGTVSGSGATYTIDPVVDFAGGETCTVTITASNVRDASNQSMASNYSWSFTTARPPVAIHDIQGAAHISPLAGQSVTTSGIVTARSSNGFWIQDPSPDNDPATSEGVFVFTGTGPTVAVGDAIGVAGRVSEFRPGGAATNLTTTEITSPTLTVLSSGNPLPAATIITTDPSRSGTNIRQIPTDVIEDDASGSVETSGTFDPANDGIDFYESLEGMRVEVDNAVASGPTNSFGELPVLADNGTGASVRTSRGGIVIRSNDFNPERIILDDALASTPDLNVGDTIPGATVGVLDYNFGNFMLEVTQDAVGQSNGLAREVTDAPGPAHLAVATFNVQNLAPTDPQTKFDGLANAIVTNLQAPDIVAVEEIQDDTGAADTGTVDADVTFGKLISAISAAGGPTYQYRQINPVDDQDGGQPGGNIRVGFLFRTDRGLAFVDRGNAGPTDADSVQTDANGAPILQYSPGRIDPTNPAFDDSRKPLAGEFTYHGHRLFVIANHFISKGGDDPLFGRFQPPENSSEAQRHQQAQVVHDFVASILAKDASADVVVLGDLNDFQFSDTIHDLQGTFLHDLITTLPASEQYTYNFEGNAEVLDHILVSGALFGPSRFQYDVVHINSEFRDQLSDHDPQVVRLLMYYFKGFSSPVDSSGLNRARAGSAVVLKWSLGPITALSSLESVQWQQTDCGTGTAVGSPEAGTTVGGTTFRYDAGSGQFVDTLATNPTWVGTCRQVMVTLDDGTVHTASFQFR